MANAIIERVGPQTVNLLLLAVVLLLAAYVVDARQRLSSLERVSMFDPLTGLLGAPYFHGHVWPARVRSSDPIAALWIDVDGLKPVNDLQGHDAGDRLIRLAADTLQGAVRRGNDVTVRLHTAGDEFLVLATLPSRGDAGRWAKNLHTAMTKAGVPCSMGMAWTDSPQHRDRAGLLKAAEGLCLAAKRSGRGRVLCGQIEQPGCSDESSAIPIELPHNDPTAPYHLTGFSSASIGQGH